MFWPGAAADDAVMTDLRNERPVSTGIPPLGLVGRVLVAAVVTIFVSSLYYIVLGDVYAQLRGGATLSTELWPIFVQLGRNLVVAAVLATLLARLGVTARVAALRVGVLVWFGFQAMEVLGSVIHEGYPFGLYLLHIGDALLTTAVMTLIVVRKPK